MKHHKIPLIEEAFRKAKLARERAHAPYSNFKVGAAIKLAGIDKLYSGCNVENASFGATVCAERVAIFSAIASKGKVPFEYMLLITDTNPCAVPCGICLQVIAEFTYPEFPIYLSNLTGIQERVMLGDLLPRGFTSFT